MFEWQVMGKFSVRLVPDMKPRKVVSLVKKHLFDVYRCRESKNIVEIKAFRDGQPFLADITSPNFTAATRAVKKVWDVWPDLTRDGATISAAMAIEVRLL